MRRLLPDPSSTVHLLDAYAVRDESDVTFVRCNMISTLDGTVTVNGRSGSLGGPPDRKVFQTLRSFADVILVGAGTVRAEGYGPPRLSDELRRSRSKRQQTDVPVIATVTRSGNLDFEAPFFVDAVQRPLVFTTNDSYEDARRHGEKVADVVLAGETRVDPHSVVRELEDRGLRSVLLEGGPGLNAEMVQAGLVDELCLTLSPLLVAGSGPRVFAGPELEQPRDVRIVHLLEEDGFLFFRLSL